MHTYINPGYEAEIKFRAERAREEIALRRSRRELRRATRRRRAQ
ncbi:MAG: hypothetical protein QM638_13785 [Nocardioides sp.]